MMTKRVDTRVGPREWDRFVLSHPESHVLQTSTWGRLKSQFGWHAERVAVRDGDVIAGGAQVLFRRLPLGWRLAYVPKGPLVDWTDVKTCQALFAGLHSLCRSRRAIMLKIEPDLPEPGNLTQLAGYGFLPGKQTVQPRRTILIDITCDEDEILRRMKSKTRYNTRLAGRKGVHVHEGSRDDVDAFTQLMTVTGERNAFGVRSAAYYLRAYELLVSADLAHLFIATYEGQPIAGVMAAAAGNKAWYMFGASGNEHREKMPNHALQWAAIRWAKSRSCRSYDLWGVPDEDQDVLEAEFAKRNEGLWGVYRFKRGFGGQLVRYIGPFDYVYSKSLCWLYHMILRQRSPRVHL